MTKAATSRRRHRQRHRQRQMTAAAMKYGSEKNNNLSTINAAAAAATAAVTYEYLLVLLLLHSALVGVSLLIPSPQLKRQIFEDNTNDTRTDAWPGGRADRRGTHRTMFLRRPFVRRARGMHSSLQAACLAPTIPPHVATTPTAVGTYIVAPVVSQGSTQITTGSGRVSFLKAHESDRVGAFLPDPTRAGPRGLTDP